MVPPNKMWKSVNLLFSLILKKEGRGVRFDKSFSLILRDVSKAFSNLKELPLEI